MSSWRPQQCEQESIPLMQKQGQLDGAGLQKVVLEAVGSYCCCRCCCLQPLATAHCRQEDMAAEHMVGDAPCLTCASWQRTCSN